MLELWLMPQLFQDKQNVVVQHDGTPSQHSRIGGCLSDGSAGRGGGSYFLASAISRSDPPLDFFLWGFVKDELYVPPVPVTLNNFKDRIRTEIAKIDQPLLENIWHEVEYRLDGRRATNGVFS
jgi:hypothetical protein